MESCEMSFIKYVLFIFNLIFAISGIGIIIAGALVLSDVGDFKYFMEDEILAPPIVLIVVAAIVFLVAFLGCFGAIRESYKLLIAFAVCLLVIFFVEMAVGVVAAIYKNDFGDALKNALKKSLENYSKNEMDKISWDNAHLKLKCCGVEGPDDWQGQPLPYSCCHVDDELSSTLNSYCINVARGKYLYETGCYDQLKIKIHENTNILIGVGIGIAFIQIVGVILACWLAHTIKNESGEK
ncbi:23 kDa integral membrane protein-like [Tribolium madens]|uniref:23 kDa integral membrane protein-like n=1 Tax=Tribolium madens TaxID=41895 RepID=UPI001CF72981|nr:23 kDa integral membrane protein-like [Tribolium madens]